MANLKYFLLLLCVYSCQVVQALEGALDLGEEYQIPNGCSIVDAGEGGCRGCDDCYDNKGLTAGQLPLDCDYLKNSGDYTVNYVNLKCENTRRCLAVVTCTDNKCGTKPKVFLCKRELLHYQNDWTLEAGSCEKRCDCDCTERCSPVSINNANIQDCLIDVNSYDVSYPGGDTLQCKATLTCKHDSDNVKELVCDGENKWRVTSKNCDKLCIPECKCGALGGDDNMQDCKHVNFTDFKVEYEDENCKAKVLCPHLPGTKMEFLCNPATHLWDLKDGQCDASCPCEDCNDRCSELSINNANIQDCLIDVNSYDVAYPGGDTLQCKATLTCKHDSDNVKELVCDGENKWRVTSKNCDKLCICEDCNCPPLTEASLAPGDNCLPSDYIASYHHSHSQNGCKISLTCANDPGAPPAFTYECIAKKWEKTFGNCSDSCNNCKICDDCKGLSATTLAMEQCLPEHLHENYHIKYVENDDEGICEAELRCWDEITPITPPALTYTCDGAGWVRQTGNCSNVCGHVCPCEHPVEEVRSQQVALALPEFVLAQYLKASSRECPRIAFKCPCGYKRTIYEKQPTGDDYTFLADEACSDLQMVCGGCANHENVGLGFVLTTCASGRQYITADDFKSNYRMRCQKSAACDCPIKN